jgi:type I restriction enzyme S subunit
MKTFAALRLRFATTMPRKSELKSLPPETEVSFLPMEAIGDDGVLDLSRTRPLSDVMSGFTYFRNGDVLIAKITPCFENRKGALAAGLKNGIGFGTTELHVLRAGKTLLPKFLFYVTLGHEFRKLGEAEMYGAGGQKRVPEPFIRDFRQLIPSAEQQKEIVTFLDRETVQIDALIESKRRLISLIRERRGARLAELATKGTSPSALKQVPGLPTIGVVPAHWDVVRSKVLFREIDERVAETATEDLLTVSHITGVTPRAEKPEVTMFMAESLEGYKRCAKNDLVINTMWAWMGALGISGYDGVVSPGYNVYRFKRKVVPEYFDHLYRTPQYIAEFTRWSKGVWTSRLRLYPDEFFQILTPVPPIEEQEKIVLTIRHETGGYDDSIRVLEESIERLLQYRTALITAAVSGQVDVRNYKAAGVASCQ